MNRVACEGRLHNRSRGLQPNGDRPAQECAGYRYEARLRGLREGGITNRSAAPVFLRKVHQQAEDCLNTLQRVLAILGRE
jgi:hypothetical protein